MMYLLRPTNPTLQSHYGLEAHLEAGATATLICSKTQFIESLFKKSPD